MARSTEEVLKQLAGELEDEVERLGEKLEEANEDNRRLVLRNAELEQAKQGSCGVTSSVNRQELLDEGRQAFLNNLFEKVGIKSCPTASEKTTLLTSLLKAHVAASSPNQHKSELDMQKELNRVLEDQLEGMEAEIESMRESNVAYKMETAGVRNLVTDILGEESPSLEEGIKRLAAGGNK